MRPYRAVGLLSLATLCVSASPLAQTTNQPPVPAKFAAEPYVYQHADDSITMHPDGTGERLLTTSVAIQSEAALRQLSVLTILFSSQTEKGDYTYVRVVHPDGSVQETPVSSAIEQPAPVTQQAPLYSDLQTKQIPVRSMRIGDRLEWQAKFIQTVPGAPNQFWFASTFQTTGIHLDDNVELRVPTGLRVTVWTNPRAHADFTESDQNGQHVYHWHHANLLPTVGAEAEAAKKKEEKRLRTADEELDDTKGALPSLGWTTFPDWNAVGNWYRGLLTDRITPDAAIKAKVAELTAGKTTQLEKAQAIYYWVSTHIRYIGVDFGIGRYQPHTAAEVFANQFGDCKDKHVLLASMLSAAGIQADPVLIGANVRFNPALPAPLSFNHLITRATIDGSPVFLDATAEIGIWAALLSPLRDHEALVVPASGPAIVAQTPANLPFPQSSTFHVVGALDNDLTSDSTITFTLRGDAELILRPVFRSLSPANYGEFVQRFMATMGFGGTTSDPSFDNVDDATKPLTINFHYHRVKEKDWGENRVTATFVGVDLPYFTDEAPATSTIDLGALRTETSTVELALPKGWTASPPEEIHARAAFAHFDVTYEQKDGKLFEQRRLTVLQSKVPVGDAKKYTAWYDECSAGSYPYIQLLPAPKVSEKAIAATPIAANPTGPAKPSDPHAAELVEKAFASMRSFDLDSARKSLDDAAQINPTQARLWLGYAAVSQLLGAYNQATQHIERELQYHPDELELYRDLARSQVSMGDTDSALQTLRQWSKAAPTSAEPVIALTRLLEWTNGHAEAMRAAALALPAIRADDPRRNDLKVLVASAEAAAGPSEQVAHEIAPLLPSLSDPGIITKAAFVLADAGVNLDAAAAAESKVLADTEAETANWTASQGMRANEVQHQLGQAWDTMACILLRQNKPREALAYADAARRLLDNSDVRKHYAALAGQLHDPAALASARATDQKLRTVPLGSSEGRTGVISFRVLLAEGRVVDVKHESSTGTRPPSDQEAEQLVRTADWHAFFPSGSKAHLLREVLVNCHQTVCEAVLGPMNAPPIPF